MEPTYSVRMPPPPDDPLPPPAEAEAVPAGEKRQPGSEPACMSPDTLSELSMVLLLLAAAAAAATAALFLGLVLVVMLEV